MTWVFVALAALVLLGLALVLAGRVDPRISPTDRPAAPPLPPAPWSAADVRALRFRVGLRGYRMDDVDAALAALAEQLPPAPADPAAAAEAAAAGSAAVDGAVTSGDPPVPPASR